MAVKSKVTMELDTLKYQSKDVQISKPAASNVAQKLYEDVLNGQTSAIQVVEMINFITEVGSQLKTKEDDNGKNKWVDVVREEIIREAGDEKDTTTSKYGTKFSLAETGTSYDYEHCGDPLWNYYDREIKRLKDLQKEREKFLKTIKDFVVMSFPDPETGELLENVELLAPIKTSTSSYKVELLKK